MRGIPRVWRLVSVLGLVLGSCTSSDIGVATTATTVPTATTELTTTIVDEPLCEPGSFDETTELDGFGVVAFVDANVIAMTDDSVQEHMTVIVEDGSIAEIGPAQSTVAPEGALEVCASGHYLLPGLSDMHVHFDLLEDRLLYVANGVTTIRNMWGGTWYPSIREQFESNTPMRRPGQVEDIACAALYLASDAASWVTGKVFQVDGGTEAPAMSVPVEPL